MYLRTLHIIGVGLVVSSVAACGVREPVAADKAATGRDDHHSKTRRPEQSRQDVDALAAVAAAGRDRDEKATPADSERAKKALLARRVEAWENDLHEKADDLAEKAEQLEKRIAEREESHKRRVAAGGVESIRDIDQMKKELETLLRQQDKIEEAIEAGPPASLLGAPEGAPTKPSAGETPSAVVSGVTPEPQLRKPPAAQSTAAGVAAVPVQPRVGVASGRTVPVRSYFKKDGTLVHAHLRSAPRR